MTTVYESPEAAWLPAPETRIAIEYVDSPEEPVFVTTWAEFLAANEFDDEEQYDMGDELMDRGFTRFGGGAAPVVVVSLTR